MQYETVIGLEVKGHGECYSPPIRTKGQGPNVIRAATAEGFGVSRANIIRTQNSGSYRR